MDVIQNKADVRRHNLPASVEGTHGTPIVYEQEGVAPATASASPGEYDNVFAYSDQLVKKNTIDLVFTACRAFPVVCSVSMVRQITPGDAYTLEADDIKQLCNGIRFTGIDYTKWRVEWSTEFTLPGLRVGKRIPTKSINHTIVSNFLQTNSFNEDSTTEALNEAGQTLLGTGILVGNQDAADGQHSGGYYIMIKYRKVRQPQQFTFMKATDYSRDVEGTGWGVVTGQVQMPVISEESMDVPTQSGIDSSDGTSATDGTPFSSSNPQQASNEKNATMYVHGKLKTHWGFRTEEESIPSVCSDTKTSLDYNKPASLNICPTIPNNTSYGLYEKSPDHQQILSSTAQTGP